MNKLYSMLFKHLLRQKIGKSIYLEGGAALSFCHGLKRKFSNDFDFTVEDETLIETLFVAAKRILSNIEPGLIFKVMPNRLSVIRKKTPLFHLDCYKVQKKNFHWKYKKMTIGNNSFLLKVHTIIDILAEKITNLAMRTEAKDLRDINKISEKFPGIFKKIDFRRMLKLKLESKELSKKVIVAAVSGLAKDTPDRECRRCYKIITEVCDEI